MRRTMQKPSTVCVLFQLYSNTLATVHNTLRFAQAKATQNVKICSVFMITTQENGYDRCFSESTQPGISLSLSVGAG